MLAHCPSLQSVKLLDCKEITGENFLVARKLPENIPFTLKAAIALFLFSSSGGISVLAKCPNIETATFGACAKITGRPYAISIFLSFFGSSLEVSGVYLFR